MGGMPFQDRIARLADTSLGRLADAWGRAYFAASRNSAAAATVCSALSVFPTALAGIAYFEWTGGNANAFAARLIDHLGLDGQIADLVRGLFGTASSNVLAATIIAVAGFLLWGLGVGQIVRDVYARAWGIEGGSAADQARYALWFFAITAVLALFSVLAEQLHAAGLLVLLPAWIVGSTAFWLWTPRFLLRGAVPLRALLPGALLSTAVVGGTLGTSPLWMTGTLNAQGRAFGAFGISLAVLAYTFIVITIALVCAVFSPVWAEWRRAERAR
jgi:membrane protein